MLPRKNVQNLYAVMAILELFEEFSGKFFVNFLTLPAMAEAGGGG